MPTDYRELIEYATPAEREAVEAVLELGSQREAAERLGMPYKSLQSRLQRLRRRAALKGHAPEHDFTKTAPEGFHVKGVSTLYGDNEEGERVVKAQWVKTQKDAARRHEEMRLAVEALCEPIRGLADPVPIPVVEREDLLTVYPIGDHHLGMYAWGEETNGDDYDLDIAERLLQTAMSKLVTTAESSARALIINVGDFFHSDNRSNRTEASGHVLDVDSRYARVIREGIKLKRQCIDLALQKHEHVDVQCVAGNHDYHSSMWMAIALEAAYENEPRVTIDTSAAVHRYFRFGKVLLGSCHGEKVKPAELASIMACDRPQDWGSTTCRHWYTGHVHHDSSKMFPGCTWESVRVLPPGDFWHSAKYRSQRGMHCDTYHRDHDHRINRTTIGISRL